MTGAALRVGLIGYGLAGRVFHAPLIEHTPGLALHCVVSSDAAKVHRDRPGMRVLVQPEALLRDPTVDLVVIATPNATHAPLAEAALDAGKHVVVDKPFALSLDQAQRVVAAAARAGRTLCAFQNRRWDGDFLTLCDVVARGDLGEVMELHSHFDRFRPQVADRWRDRTGPGAGLWWDLGPHLVDQAIHLLGPPQAVQADLVSQRAGATVDDWFHVVLRYPRARAVLHGGSLVCANAPRFAVHGSRGSFVSQGLDPQEAALRDGRAPDSAGWGDGAEPVHITTAAEDGPQLLQASPRRGDWPRFYAQLRDALRGHGPPPISTTDMLHVMQVMEAAQASAASGRVQPIAS